MSKTRWIVAAMAAVAVAAAVPSLVKHQRAAARAQAQQRALARASMLLENGETEAAFLVYQNAAELDPLSPAGWLGVARCYLAAKMPWAGEPAATRAVESAPAADAFLARAQLREQLHRNYSAALDAKAALQLDPRNAAAKAVLLRVQAAAPAAPSLAPAREKFWPGRLGEFVAQVPQELRRRNFESAHTLAAAAGRDYPGTMIGPWLDGITSYAQGKFPEAEKALRHALEFAPRSSRVATNLAGAWAKQQGPQYAAEQLVALNDADPGFLVPLDIAATAYLEARAPAKAEAALKRGTGAESPLPSAYLQLGNWYASLDRPAEALAACGEGLARFPHDLELQLCRARGQSSVAPGEAIASYEAIVRARPDNWPARVALARLYASRDDPGALQRAAEITDNLRSDSPDDPVALDAVGWTLAHLKDRGAARPWLALAARGAPDDPGVRYHYAWLLAQLGDRGGARAELDAALALGKFAERVEAQALLNKL